MQCRYVHKEGGRCRASKSAFAEFKENKHGINEISRLYRIPPKTLSWRFSKQNTKKLILGWYSSLDDLLFFRDRLSASVLIKT